MSETNGRNDVLGPAEGRGRPWALVPLVPAGAGHPRRLFGPFGPGVMTAVPLVAGFLSIAVAGLPASASPTNDAVRSTVMAGKLEGFRRACSDEIVNTTPIPVKVGPSAIAVLVKLTSSKGLCFGQPGENDYLLVQERSGWRSILAAEPGSIRVGRPDVNGFAVVTLYSLGMCKITYKRTASGFKAAASKDCHGLNGAPSLLDVTEAVRE